MPPMPYDALRCPAMPCDAPDALWSRSIRADIFSHEAARTAKCAAVRRGSGQGQAVVPTPTCADVPTTLETRLAASLGKSQ